MSVGKCCDGDCRNAGTCWPCGDPIGTGIGTAPLRSIAVAILLNPAAIALSGATSGFISWPGSAVAATGLAHETLLSSIGLRLVPSEDRDSIT